MERSKYQNRFDSRFREQGNVWIGDIIFGGRVGDRLKECDVVDVNGVTGLFEQEFDFVARFCESERGAELIIKLYTFEGEIFSRTISGRFIEHHVTQMRFGILYSTEF